MSSNQPVSVEQPEVWMPIHKSEGRGEVAAAGSRAARAESLQRTGKRVIIAGFVITILCVVAYCAANFAGGVDADMSDILFRNAVPYARMTLAFQGLGILVWLVGSFTYLRGVLEADDGPGEDGTSSGE